MAGRPKKSNTVSSSLAEGQSPLSPAVFHVLLSLSEGPLHGYGVMRSAEASSGMVMGPGTVYGALARLAEAGWVAAVESAAAVDDSTADRRRGRSFRLTDSGEAALAAEARRLTGLAALDQVQRLAAASRGQG